MTLQSSRTAHTRFMERFVVIGTKSKSDKTPIQINEWHADYAKSKMAKRGEFEELLVKSTDVGGFKQGNLSSIFCL